MSSRVYCLYPWGPSLILLILDLGRKSHTALKIKVELQLETEINVVWLLLIKDILFKLFHLYDQLLAKLFFSSNKEEHLET